MLNKWFLTALLMLGAAGVTWAGTVVTPITTGVTTDTTSTAVRLSTVEGKSFYGEVICSSGACAQTQAIYGDIDDDATNGILMCTITLSGTPRDQDACAVVTAQFAYYYVVTTSTSGTGATGAVYALY